ncbi:hypothetical protein Tco_0902546 [Tanacetum coccineum]
MMKHPIFPTYLHSPRRLRPSNFIVLGVEIRDENSYINVPNPNSFNDPPNILNHPPQPQYESYSCELCGNDSHYGYDYPPQFRLVYEQEPCYNQNFGDNDYPYNSPRLLITGNEELSTIPKKESDEFIKSSVKDLVLIPSESEDTSESDSDCDLASCDDFSPIDAPEAKSVTFSNLLFDLNDDVTSSDDESLSDEEVPEDNVKKNLNPLFEFNDEYISSDVNPLFDEVFGNIENKDSYVSDLDEPALLVTPLSDFNRDECFDPGGDIDEINALLDTDVSTNIEDGYHDNDNLMTDDKVFDPWIPEKIVSPTYVSLPFEDRHYLSLTYVIRIFLPYFTYPVVSPFLLSSGSEDTTFDPDISVLSFYSLKPVASHRSGTFVCLIVYLNILNESPMEICSSTCFDPNITMIWGESSYRLAQKQALLRRQPVFLFSLFIF